MNVITLLEAKLAKGQVQDNKNSMILITYTNCPYTAYIVLHSLSLQPMSTHFKCYGSGIYGSGRTIAKVRLDMHSLYKCTHTHIIYFFIYIYNIYANISVHISTKYYF